LASFFLLFLASLLVEFEYHSQYIAKKTLVAIPMAGRVFWGVSLFD
jgi:hypothetical protein